MVSRMNVFVGIAATSMAAGLGMDAKAVSVIDFENYNDGDIVSGEIASGVHFSVNNVNGDPDQAAAWDATAHPKFDGMTVPWTNGNIDANYDPGVGVLIQGIGSVIPRPEGSRPNGDMTFEFDEDITSFGFDIFDIDGEKEFQTHTGYFVAFFNDGSEVGSFTFEDLVTPGNPLYDPDHDFADGSANRIAPVTAGDLGVSAFNKVVIVFGGSGFLDNVTYTPANGGGVIPTPAAAGAGLVMVGLAALRRRRQG